jgi:1,4-dihydroxy-2-naphthoate octaprenyltransferase
VGLLAAAILLVNNIRDADTDRRAGKKTLAVRLGRSGARGLFVACVVIAYLAVPLVAIFGREISPLVLLALLSLPLAVALIRTVRTRTDGPSLNEALAKTGMLLALFSLLLSIGLVAS